MTEIYLHIVARMADYIAAHPYLTCHGVPEQYPDVDIARADECFAAEPPLQFSFSVALLTASMRRIVAYDLENSNNIRKGQATTVDSSGGGAAQASASVSTSVLPSS